MTAETIIALGYGRAPEDGELCTCGRPAVVVYSTREFGDVGSCNSQDAHPAEVDAS